jgi:predicted HTH transcriptional regulator
MFELEKIKTVIAHGECVNIEFKKSYDSLSRSAFETICAFLNRKGGYIFSPVAISLSCKDYRINYRIIGSMGIGEKKIIEI